MAPIRTITNIGCALRPKPYETTQATVQERNAWQRELARRDLQYNADIEVAATEALYNEMMELCEQTQLEIDEQNAENARLTMLLAEHGL
tara:strand:- start:663 stop:932 length:270 start_codon:yes stop_codon:yes gene_type:complete